MYKAYVIERENNLVFCEEEASHLSEGTPIIAGTFVETKSAWSGIFTTDCGQVYKINDGHVLKEAP